MTTLNYTIRKFDTDNKIVTVDYDDGSWAQIQLKTPLPADRSQLDAIIKQYAASHETVVARIETVDLSFIDQLVGVAQTTTRFSSTASSTSFDDLNNAPADQTIYMSDITHNHKVQFSYDVAEVLVKLGLIETNPIDLSTKIATRTAGNGSAVTYVS